MRVAEWPTGISSDIRESKASIACSATAPVGSESTQCWLGSTAGSRRIDDVDSNRIVVALA
jgi:hypothetical protein